MNSRTPQANLLSLCILELDPRVADRRMTLHKLLVQVALLDFPEGLDIPHTKAAMEEILEHQTEIIEDELNAALDDMAAEGIVIKSGDSHLKLAESRALELHAAVEKLDNHRQEFKKGLVTAVENRLGAELGEGDREEFCATMESYLQSMIHAEILDLGVGRENFEDLVARHPEGSKSTTVDEKLREALSDRLGHLTASQLAAGVRDYFRILPLSGKKYLESLQVRVIGAQILYLDPEHQKYLRKLFRSRMLYLDTNVLIAYFFEADDHHGLTPDVISASLALGSNLLVTPETVAEFRGQINQANREYSIIGGVPLATVLGPAFESSVLKTYYTRRSVNPQLSWRAFISTFENIEEFLFANNILVADGDKRGDNFEETVREACDILSQYKWEATADAIFHDASNMVVVQLLRDKRPTDELGSQVWLLTLDNGLLRSQRHFHERFKDIGQFATPVAAHLSTWGARIGKYQNALTFIYDDYIAYLVRSKLGLIAIDRQGINADFLGLLTQAILEIDVLLELPEEIVSSVIISLQEDSEARKLVEEVVSEKEDSWQQVKREELLRRLLSSVSASEYAHIEKTAGQLAFLQSTIETLGKKLSDALSSRAKVKSELDEIRTNLAELNTLLQEKDNELEQVRKQLEFETTRSLFSRILEELGIGRGTKNSV